MSRFRIVTSRVARALKSRTVVVLGVIVVFLVAARVALPHVVEYYVDKKLDELEGYSGDVRDVDLNLWRGAYEIEGVRIVKTGGRVPVPFFRARKIDISVEWSALLDGSVVSEIELYHPVINFVTAPNRQERQTEASSNWQETVKDLTPFRINRFAIHRGEVHYRDFHSDPKVDIYVQRLNGQARNLTNSKDLSGSLVSTFQGTALAMKSGRIKLKGRFNPYADEPTFELDLALNDLDVRQLNDYLRAYGNVDAEAGKFSMDAEFAASRGRLSGYVKPFIDDLDVLRWKEEGESLPNKLWQGLVEVVAEVLEDRPKERIATKIPFEGSLKNPDADTWSTIGGLLKNAFIEALRRGIEGSIGVSRTG